MTEQVYYVVACVLCGSIIPFHTWEKRDTWVREHSQATDLDGKRHHQFILREDER